MAFLELDHVRKVFPGNAVPAVEDFVLGVERRRVYFVSGSQRLRQDDDAAHDRRLRFAVLRQHYAQ